MNDLFNVFDNVPRMRGVNHIHFIGIGGAGMSGIADVSISLGYKVTGSDVVCNSSVVSLKKRGAHISIGHGGEYIKGADVVVYSTAILESNLELLMAREVSIPTISRAEMLSELMRYRYSIAVSGTHGKTTTSSMLASVFQEDGKDPTFIIGGVLNSLGCNARVGVGQHMIVEADESDSSFLKLYPEVIIVTNIDCDHMVTYQGDVDNLKKAFLQFIGNLPFYGLVVICLDDPIVKEIIPLVEHRVVTYGLTPDADYSACNIRQNGVETRFNLVRKGQEVQSDLQMSMPGKHNVLNALAAVAVACEESIAIESIQLGLLKFQGVHRRFQINGEFPIKEGKIRFIDDYGHHPSEIASIIATLKSVWPGQRIVMIYQPHRYSRTYDLYKKFVNVLSEVDVLVMLDVFAATESPILGIDSYNLCKSIRENGGGDPIYLNDRLKIKKVLEDTLQDSDLLLTQGAGDIGMLASDLVSDWIH